MQTTPKHGKRLENRLYSKIRRGSSTPSGNDRGGMNPDGGIEVVAVCGLDAMTYDTVKNGRRLLDVRHFPSHGAAVLYAQECDDFARQSLARRS